MKCSRCGKGLSIGAFYGDLCLACWTDDHGREPSDAECAAAEGGDGEEE